MSEFPDAEIIVVNDGSEDGTAQVAHDAGVRVIEHDRNRGYGAALRTGTEHADREYVLFCDSDGQHRAQDIPAFSGDANQIGYFSNGLAGAINPLWA